MAHPNLLFNGRMLELKKMIDRERNIWGSTEMELFNGAAFFASGAAKQTLENEGYTIRRFNDRVWVKFPEPSPNPTELVEADGSMQYSGLGVPYTPSQIKSIPLFNIHYSGDPECECSKCNKNASNIRYNSPTPIGWPGK